MKAIWNGGLLAESNRTLIVEGNHYFPPDSLNREYFRNSDTTSLCAWKGMASYYTICIGDKINPDAAWYYPSPSSAAAEIRNHVAFWHGVEVTE
ncbi:MAG: DUF427 domain-containing protein [Candidatus Thiodiazotropha sp.]